jgi:CHAD domain-containing protein
MTSTSGKPAVSAERERLRQLTAALKQNLEACVHDADVEVVHNIRTGTRRIEALLESIVRERLPPGSVAGEEKTAGLREAAQRWLRLLKKIRRTAATVRDLDVHRKLLEKRLLLKEQATAGADSPASSEEVLSAGDGAGSGSVSTSPAADSILQQAADLDAWLKNGRQERAQPLIKVASKWATRLDKELASFEEVLRVAPSRRRSTRGAALVALEAFARLATQMERLDSGNLHDFRKGAKKARYMAEAGGEDREAGAVGKALKRLQDEIGDWHDWLVLAEEAHQALGEDGTELAVLLETERDRYYSRALNTTERMRGRLMGELQALSPVRRGSARPPRSSTVTS